MRTSAPMLLARLPASPRRPAVALLAALLLVHAPLLPATDDTAVGNGGSDEGSVAAVPEDRRLAARLADLLAWDADLAPFALDVRVENSIVRLSGTVATSAQSHAARRIADTAEGTAGVVNAIYVDPTLVSAHNDPAQPDDATLEHRIRQVLAADPDLAAADVDIQVRNARVTLAGHMPDTEQKARAERRVRALYGVDGVLNDIAVTPRSAVSPDDVQHVP